MSPKDTTDAPVTGGLRAPRSAFRRVLRRLVGLLFGLVVLLVVIWGLGRLPSDTSTGSLVVRGLTGLGIGLVFVLVVRRMLGALTEPPPPPPERVDARATDVVYVCGICGTRLRLEVAATGKPPRHCGEEMEPQVSM